jgi:hypothetical protein
MVSMRAALMAMVCLASTICLTGCPWDNGETPDNTGLRLYAYEQTSILNSDFPVDGVIDGGSATGTGGIGGALSFAGVTKNGGIDDHYGINLGTTWEITYNWQPVIPPCGVDIHNDVYLDPAGDFISETCVLF